MKIGIKKLMNLGLEKEDIKAELKLNNEQIERYENQGKKVEIENLPEILDKYNTDKILKHSDRIKAEILDRIFSLSNVEMPTMDIKEKSELIDLLPNLLEELKEKNVEKKVQKLIEQIETITDEINELRSKVNLGKIKFVIENAENQSNIEYKEEIKENNKFDDSKESTIHHLIYKTEINVQSTNYKLGNERCGLYVKTIVRDKPKIKINDILAIKDEKNMIEYKYRVVEFKNNYLLCRIMQD